MYGNVFKKPATSVKVTFFLYNVKEQDGGRAKIFF